uniref:Fdx3 n=1 Tax=Arundo donax TaxID=35708 RepID=A0A0A9CXX3_ARUDO
MWMSGDSFLVICSCLNKEAFYMLLKVDHGGWDLTVFLPLILWVVRFQDVDQHICDFLHALEQC